MQDTHFHHFSSIAEVKAEDYTGIAHTKRTEKSMVLTGKTKFKPIHPKVVLMEENDRYPNKHSLKNLVKQETSFHLLKLKGDKIPKNKEETRSYPI